MSVLEAQWENNSSLALPLVFVASPLSLYRHCARRTVNYVVSTGRSVWGAVQNNGARKKKGEKRSAGRCTNSDFPFFPSVAVFSRCAPTN